MSVVMIDLSPMTVSQRRTVKLERLVLEHLKVKPGGRIEVDLLANGCCVLRGARTGDIRDLLGILAGVPRGREGAVSIEEMNETIAKGWAGEP
ncbi:MAG: AbrB/MazE/SpoVT family DNA-binding domain-containing protein [Mitsuaria chitosanitabida]|uniref:AbrB/MazE/SpoVT family DNA-binding domain-containing protein n=1 Tax=Roseateles chitosanitabidus TaxID=65048 RepID=UPI001B167753|nr:AbrB/MazE/SpoVT family DNA-binding domain-containing protein [Roseateles chitosanitabidus]MBO9689569.1 AbrB/MazE/SpoVT family DNA-binding domain-containing protein [Roseateles chitosanitabidus]